MTASKIRIRSGIICLLTGAALAAQGLVVASHAASAPVNTGSASLSLTLPQLALSGPVGAARSLALGTITVAAQSIPPLGATLALAGPTAMGQAAQGVDYSSAQGNQAGNATVPVSAGPVTGSVGLVNYAVNAGAGSALAQLGGLTGTLGVSPLNLAADLGTHGLLAQAGPTASAAGLDLTSPGINIDLADLLPANVLAGLPLGVVVNLLQTTGVTLSPTLTSELSRVRSLLGDAQSLSTDLTSLSGAEATVASLIASNTALAAAQAAVTSQTQTVAGDQATVTSAQSALTAAQATQSTDQSTVNSDQSALTAAQATLSADQTAEAAACLLPLSSACTTAKGVVAAAQSVVTSDQATLTAAQAALTTANQTVTTDQSALTAAQAALATAQATLATDQATLANLAAQASAPGSPLATAEGLVTTLTTTVDSLLTQLQGLLGTLPNLQSVLAQLTGALANAPLIGIGNLAVGLNVAANAKTDSASVTCTLGSVSVLGKSVAAPTCEGLSALLKGISGQLSTALSILPASAKPSLSLSGLEPITSTSAASPDGTLTASAGLSALDLAISPISLSGLVDSLTSQLQAQLQAITTALGNHSLLTRPALDAHALSVPSGLSGLLGTLTTQVSALPTGSALSGLSTLGLAAGLAGVTSQANYRGASSSTPAPAGTAPVNSTTGNTTAPPGGVTTGGTPGSLPFTGSNSLPLLATGLLLIVMGSQLLIIRRQLPAVVRS